MPSRLHHLLPLQDKTKDEILDTGTIVLDTNILLHVYRFDNTLRTDFLSVLDSKYIQQRVWFPFQIAEEFLRNRPTVISDQADALKKLEDACNKGFSVLKNGAEVALGRYHPVIKRDDFCGELDQLRKQVMAKVHGAKGAWGVTPSKDPYLDAVLGLLAGRTGDPLPDADMKALVAEAPKRFKEKVPPGYYDHEKEFQDSLGDLVLWRQCLAKLKDPPLHLLFVTDDDKEDWWQKHQGERLGARPELRKEYFDVTGKHCLFMSGRMFVDWAKDHVKISAEKMKQMSDAISWFAQYERALRTEVRLSPGMQPKNVMASTYARLHSEVDPGLQKAFRLRGRGERQGDPNSEFYTPTDASVKILEVTKSKDTRGVRPVTFPASFERGEFWPTLMLIQMTPEEFEKHEQDMRMVENTILPEGLILGEEVWTRP